MMMIQLPHVLRVRLAKPHWMAQPALGAATVQRVVARGLVSEAFTTSIRKDVSRCLRMR